MEYQKYGDTIVLRLDKGEEICESLLDVAAKENIGLAEVSGLAALGKMVVGLFDTDKKVFVPNTYEKPLEVTSLVGNLSRMDGKPYLHCHMSAADIEGNVYGGHLSQAVVSATAEILVRVVPGTVERAFDEEVGLNLIKF